jgi:predicted dehydrogenase
MRWVGEATNVMARTKVVSKQRVDAESGEPRPATVPDYVEVIADMACGAIARLHFSNVTGLSRTAEIWLYGSEGTLYYDNASRTLSGGRRGDKALQPIEIPAEQQAIWRVEEEFVNAVRGLEPVRRTSFADGVRYMEFTEAVTRSALSGSAVPLPLPEC